jgi:ATP-dependent Clp protease ATP-binding subunit ClpC
VFHLYTERAMRVMYFANMAAGSHGSAVIEPVHVLSALLRDAGMLWVGLLDADADLALLRRTVESSLQRGSADHQPSRELPVSAKTESLLARTRFEAQQLSAPGIQPEHILLGVLADDSCIQVLVGAGVDARELDARLREHL